MPRFVLLQHDHPFLHWDFMLERGAALRTWRLPQPPTAGVVLDATPLGEHRLAYLDYEGPLSGDRGTVSRWDHGTYDAVEDSGHHVVLRLCGHKVQGTATLTCLKDELWSFVLQANP
jgi:hypothetical protein